MPSRLTFGTAFVGELQRSFSVKLGLAAVLLVLFAAIFAPLIAPFDPDLTSLPGRRALPSVEHPLGNDELGRDLLSRIVYGSRIALMVGGLAVSISLVIGVPLGLVSGFYGGGLDKTIMSVMDVLLAFPNILLAIAIVSALGPDIRNATLAIGLWTVPAYARLARASVLTVRTSEYVTAARAMGASNNRILTLHVFPNILSPIIVNGTLNFARAILAEASLSFLGLGAQPPTPSWGLMASTGRAYLLTEPHIATFPGLAIMFTVLGFNLLGDGLRDALDPRNRRQAATRGGTQIT
jgi:peptide/nickel transport system permease protein